MTALTPLMPRQPVPDLELETAGGNLWRLTEQSPENFLMVVFYRGLHCPICKNYLADLNRKLGDFGERGIDVVAVSSDTRERAAQTVADWELEKLAIGYGLSLDKAREWGLYISTSRGKTSLGIDEPALFSEPAIYLIRPDKTLYFGSVQTMPFARPNFREILGAVDFVLKADYPARGEVVDHRAAA